MKRAEEPQGPPVVFVHGAGGTRAVWTRLEHALSRQGRRVLSLDLPGHGGETGPGCARVGDYAGWVLRRLEGEGPSRPVLAGHSMGGAVALACALSSPGTFSGIILMATGARLRVNEAVLGAVRGDFARAVDMIVGYAFAPGAPPVMAEETRRELLACPPGVLEGDLRACDAFDVMDRLGGIALPALVVCGEHDALTPPKYARFLAEEIPGARLAIVEGAGHMLMLERPADVRAAVASFLDSLP